MNEIDAFRKICARLLALETILVLKDITTIEEEEKQYKEALKYLVKINEKEENNETTRV